MILLLENTDSKSFITIISCIYCVVLGWQSKYVTYFYIIAIVICHDLKSSKFLCEWNFLRWMWETEMNTYKNVQAGKQAHTHTHARTQLQRCGNMRNFNESNAESQSAIIEGCVQISSFWEPTISSVTLNREDNYTLQEGFACRSMYLTWGDKYSHTLKTSRTISKDWYSWNEKRKYLAWTNKRYRPHQFDPFF